MPEETLHTANREYNRQHTGNYTRQIIATLAIMLVAAGAWFWWADGKEATTEPTTPTIKSPSDLAQPSDAAQPMPDTPAVEHEVVASTPSVATVEAPPPSLPSLAASDKFVREQLKLPELITQQHDLLAKLSVVIASAADGLVSTKLLRAVAPIEKFAVVEVDEAVYLDPSSYARYDSYVHELTQIPPDKAAAFLNKVEPLLVEGLLELGDSRAPRVLVTQAIKRVQDLPEIPQEIALVSDKAVYSYADTTLENLPEFEKQMLRVGPNNLALVQSWLHQFEQAYAQF